MKFDDVGVDGERWWLGSPLMFCLGGFGGS